MAKGEELAVSGTAGNILSIYDHADVKLIPAAKEVLGTVKLADGSGNSLSSFTAQPTNQRGLDVYIDSANILSLAAGQSIIAQGSASLPLNQDNTGSLLPPINTLAQAVFAVGTTRVAVMVANSKGGVIQNSGTTDIFIGDSTVTTAKGIKLAANTLTPLSIPSLSVAGLIYAIGSAPSGEVRVLYQT